MRIFVSSGSSSVGQSILEHLENTGHQVLYSWATKKPTSHKSHAVQVDFLNINPAAVDCILSFNPEAIIVCTGAYTGNISDLSIINVSGATILTQVAKRCDTSILIHLSSLSVYGWPLPEYVDRAEPSPSDSYGNSKLLQERIFDGLKGDLSSVFNLRLPVVLGPRAHRAWLPSVRDLLQINADINYNNPTARYSAFTTITAICSFVEHLLNSRPPVHSSFPIGGIGDITVHEMLTELRSLLKSSSKLVVKDTNTPMAIIESTIALSLGYKPPSIKEALKEFIC